MNVPRPRGLSVRVKLALSYAGFLVVAGIALFAVGFLLLRFIPAGNLSVSGGGFAPSRADLMEVFVRYAWWTMGLLVVFGLVGGWLLAGVVLRPLHRIADAAARGIRLDSSLPPATVMGDRTLLAQLASNLLDNAVAHNVDGGWVSIADPPPGRGVGSGHGAPLAGHGHDRRDKSNREDVA